MFWIGLAVGFCICVALLATLAAIAAGVEKKLDKDNYPDK